MTNSQNDDLFAIEVVEGKIAAAAEFNEPFHELWQHVLNESASFRVPCQRLYLLTNCLDSASGRIRALGYQKSVQAN